MARPVEGAWFRTAKNAWYATVDGRAVSLGVKGEAAYRDAQEAYYRLLATVERASSGPGTYRPHPVKPSAKLLTVAELIDAFFTDAESRLKPNTIRIYRYDVDAFGKKFGRTIAAELTAGDVVRWVNELGVNPTTKGIAIRSLSAVFGWAVRNDMIATNPVKRVPRPKVVSRGCEAVIDDQSHRVLLAGASDNFRTVLRVLHGTGCRPGEACRIAVENFDAENGVVRLTEHKTDRTGTPRVIFLTPELTALFVELAERVKCGPLLRTKHGNPWTGRSITTMMQQTRKRTGVRATAYGYRHTFATDALAGGMPETVVAELMGHKGTAMLHKHYSHLGAKAAILKNAMSRIRS